MPTNKQNQIVLVDKHDKIVGFGDKLKVHQNPVPLHRAISIVIFNKDKTQMLLTQRAGQKPTWPLFWSNAVCTHPFVDEDYQHAAQRRLVEEAGFPTELHEVFRFTYKAQYEKVWGEHEYDVVFVGHYEGEIVPNPDEIAQFKWMNLTTLAKDVSQHPIKYTPWFKIILEKLKITDHN